MPSLRSAVTKAMMPLPKRDLAHISICRLSKVEGVWSGELRVCFGDVKWTRPGCLQLLAPEMKVSASASASVLRSVACGIADGITTGDDKDIKINK